MKNLTQYIIEALKLGNGADRLKNARETILGKKVDSFEQIHKMLEEYFKTVSSKFTITTTPITDKKMLVTHYPGAFSNHNSEKQFNRSFSIKFFGSDNRKCDRELWVGEQYSMNEPTGRLMFVVKRRVGNGKLERGVMCGWPSSSSPMKGINPEFKLGDNFLDYIENICKESGWVEFSDMAELFKI